MLSQRNIPLLEHAQTLDHDYDVWLCDIWGVLHNGLVPFPTAADACGQFRQHGGTVALISNSPRPSNGVIEQMRAIGVSDETWDAVVTSGDVTRNFIGQWRGKPVHHLGPERDRPLFDGLDVQFASLEEAAVVVNTGLLNDETETPDDYTGTLTAMLKRGQPMICANPDLVVERGDKLVYCAGALADRYQELGGEVLVGGKPYRPIYDQAIAAAEATRGASIDRTRVLAIGDSVRTDMTGAHNAGLDALFVASALHVSNGQKLDEQALADIFADKEFRPVAAQPTLTW